MFGFLGEIFTLTNIHWHSLHTSTFYIDVVIEFDLGYWAIGETYRKNRCITHIFRHSIGLVFYWYAEVLVPYL